MPRIKDRASVYIAHRYGVIHDLRAAHEQIKILREAHARELRARDDEIARLMAIIRAKDDGLRNLTFLLQDLINEKTTQPKI